MSQENDILVKIRDQLKSTCVELKQAQRELDENPQDDPRKPGERDYEMPVKAAKNKIISEAQSLKEKLVKYLNESLLDEEEKEYWNKFNQTVFSQWKNHDLCFSCELLNDN